VCHAVGGVAARVSYETGMGPLLTAAFRLRYGVAVRTTSPALSISTPCLCLRQLEESALRRQISGAAHRLPA
jgi:hypothetical protein